VGDFWAAVVVEVDDAEEGLEGCWGGGHGGREYVGRRRAKGGGDGEVEVVVTLASDCTGHASSAMRSGVGLQREEK
jgi:hypothetical protein